MGLDNTNSAKFAEKLPLEKFIPAAFLIFLLCFIILSIITYNNISLHKTNIEQADQTNKILQKTDEINLTLSNLHLQRRSYIIKKDEKNLEKYKELQKKLDLDLQILKELVKDHPVQSGNMFQIDSLSRSMISLLDSSISLFHSEGNISTFQTDLAIKAQDELEQLNQVSNDLREKEYNLLSDKQKNSRINLSDTQIFIIITSLFAFIVLGLSLYIFNKLIKNKNEGDELLKRSYDELEGKVIERTAELKNSNDHLINEVNNRIKIENSLRESESRFREMADSAPALIWISGKDKRCEYFNKGWLDFRGRTLKQEAGNGWVEGIFEEDLERTLSAYSAAFESRDPFETEYRLQTAAGDYRWILSRGIPRYTGSDFAGYIGIAIDIHEKKRTERYLKIQYSVSNSLAEAENTEQALQNVLENICSGVNWKFGIAWVVEDDHITKKAIWSENPLDSKKFSKIFNNNSTLTKGAGLSGKVWETGKSQWIEDLKSEGDLPRKEEFLSLGWQSGFAVPIADGDKVIAVIECFNRNKLNPKNDLMEVLESVGKQVGNFLERKRAEENLKTAYDELEQRVSERTIELANTLNRLLDEMSIKEKVQSRLKLFGHALRGIKECVFITNLQNRTIFVNPAFETIYGYLERELLDKNIPVLYTESITDEKRREILSETLKNGWSGELINKRSDGSEFYIYLSSSVIRDEEGKVDSIVGIVQDITEEKNNFKLLEKRFNLLNMVNEVAVEANRFTNSELCIQYSIDKVCEYTGWEIGHYLKVENDKIISSGIWNKDLDPEFDVFRALSEELKVAFDNEIIEKIISSKIPLWEDIDSFTEEGFKDRIDICIKTGIKTGIWVPVFNSDKLSGIIEFFSSGYKQKDKEELDSILNIANEISNIKQKNEFINAIKESEKHFSAISETANDAIITADSEGKIVYVNSSITKIFGYETFEILNNSLDILIPVDNNQKINLNNALKTDIPELLGKTTELIGRKKDGTEIPIELSLAMWEQNGKSFLTGMLRDISSRKSIEKELIENRNSLIEAQTIAKLGNWNWDIINNKVTWSDEMYNIYEISQDKFDHSLEGFLSLLHPEDKNMIQEKISSAAANKENFEFNERIITLKGNLKILRSSGGVRIDDKGNVTNLVGTCLDITEIHEAEQRVRENEERLSLIMENIKDYAILLLDHEGNIKSWNNAAEQIKGYSKEEILGKHISVFYNDEDLTNKIPQHNLKMAAEHGRHESQGWRKRKDGTQFWADIIFSALYDGENLKGFIKVTRDITERRKAERDLIESEKRLKEAQEIAKLGSWEWDAVNDTVKWSEEMYNIFEIPADTNITKDLYLEMLEDESKKIREEAINNALNGNGKFDYFLKIKSKTGKIKIIHSQGEITMNESGEVRRMVGTFMDVTLMKEAEEKIILSEKQLKEAQSIAKLGSWQADFASGKVVWSDEMYNIHEFEPGSVSLDYSNIRRYIYHKDQPNMDKLIASLEKNPHNAEINYRIVTPSGRLKFLSLELRVEYDKKKKPVRLYGSVQDITEIKLVEEELRKTNAKLIEAQKELIHNEKLAALGRFSSGIAHEIRNPLANISALAQLISKARIEDEKMKKHLKYILINSDIANKIIKDLLNFASPEDLVLDDVKISELLENTVNSIEPRCTEKNIIIIKKIPSDLPIIKADKVKLENAMLNFISNAMDAIESGGNITVKAIEDKIHHQVIIDIIDTGKGIPPENLDKIFEPFFTTKESGTGLGLGLAYQYIKSHNGILNITSNEGKGTHVEIKLPVKNK